MKKKKDSGIPSFGRILEAWDVIITTEKHRGNAGMKNINPNSVSSVNSVVKTLNTTKNTKSTKNASHEAAKGV